MTTHQRLKKLGMGDVFIFIIGMIVDDHGHGNHMDPQLPGFFPENTAVGIGNDSCLHQFTLSSPQKNNATVPGPV